MGWMSPACNTGTRRIDPPHIYCSRTCIAPVPARSPSAQARRQARSSQFLSPVSWLAPLRSDARGWHHYRQWRHHQQGFSTIVLCAELADLAVIPARSIMSATLILLIDPVTAVGVSCLSGIFSPDAALLIHPYQRQ